MEQNKNFYEELKQYFETTPREKVLEDWAKTAECDKVGPTVEEFLENTSRQENVEVISPMNDLLQDLKETKVSVKDSIDIIEDEFIRNQINIFVQKTLDSVIDRIENELLETESKFQQEQDKNKYSEEEVLELLHKRMIYTLGNDYQEITTTKWFEQFKKKQL